MNQDQLQEITDVLPRERTLFHYYRDHYALLLLGYALRRDVKLSSLRQTPFGRLLSKPVLKPTLERLGDGTLSSVTLQPAWTKGYVSFLLTLGCWGGRHSIQTTRPGYNLVLQLNFSNQHDRPFRRLVQPREDAVFNYCGHPHLKRNERSYFRETLAWSRLDISLEHREAVIEEIQSDWVRCAREAFLLSKKSPERLQKCWDMNGTPERFTRYMENVLAPYLKLWDEAMLAATIFFLHEELGIKTIYYHTAETGRWLKSIGGRNPPHSLYTDLPRRFCFSERQTMPSFLRNDWYVVRKLKQHSEPRWFVLDLQIA